MTSYRCLIAAPGAKPEWRTVEASSEQMVLASLAADGATPLEIRSGPASFIDRLNEPIHFGRRLSASEQSLLLTQLATLVKAGLPVDRSLDLLREQAPRAGQREVLRQALDHVRSGHGLAAAFEHCGVFPTYVVGVIRAAERSGGLGRALTTVADRLTLAASTQRQLVTALTYPAAILLTTLSALALVLTLVIPQFEPIFAGQEAELPTLTRFVLSLSRSVTDGGWVLGGALLIPVLLGIGLSRVPAASAMARRLRRRIPGSGLRDQYLGAQLAGILGTLLGSGVSVVAALPLAAQAIGSGSWRDGLEAAQQRVKEGQPLSRALGAAELLPATAIRLIEVGERTGALADTCVYASQILGDAAKARLDRIVALANPAAIIVLGGIVAALVAGVMLGILALDDIAS